ncbi:Nuclear transcription factor Y subunit C-5 [Thelohanellus kitauei]|uniref:Nuclear transcription factor Y subunit C-5 n=1 Tax=Thelohanellus kitauei TaxID=669202 RepID=A0A0C2MIQ3_THEKT|nr:Nuclear transcription factor Y subunit C-5 [Thelohanellus kitauei]
MSDLNLSYEKVQEEAENDISCSIMNKTAEEPYEAFSGAFHKREQENNQNPSPRAIPISRVKRIMKLDPDVGKIDKECLYFLSDICEEFAEDLARKVVDNANKRNSKAVTIKDFNDVIQQNDTLSFLDGLLE